MIVRQQPSTLHLFFVLRGSILSKIYPKILFFAAWAGVVSGVAQMLERLPSPSISSMSVFGVALTLFLGFRNTVVFDRWWEARKLWGGIVAGVRAISLDCLLHVQASEDRRLILTQVSRFFHAHRNRLRGTADLGQSPMQAEPPPGTANPAAHWLNEAARLISVLARDGKIDQMGRLAFSNRLAELAGQQAGNERIKSTPVPFVYSLLVRRTTYVYCICLPFALADTVGLFSPVIMTVVAYVFFGLQAVTNELEDPFTLRENALPLNAICRTCDNTLLEALGDPPLPAIEPQNFVLT